MTNKKRQWIILSILFVLFAGLPLFLNACAGDATSPGAGQGTAAVLVKDAFQVSLDGRIITEIQLKISGIFLKKEMEPEDAWVQVPLNPDLIQPFNLLDLNNVAMVAAIGQVPSGEYEKVRMILDESFTPCIVFQDTPDVCEPLKVPSHKIDILLKPHVLVPEGRTASILLDFVPDRSIHLNETGSEKYILRPTVFAVTAADIPDGVRVHHEISGTITGCTEDTLELTLRHEAIHVNIHYDQTTQFFSHEEVEDGEDHVLLTGVACDDLMGKRVEVKVLALPDGVLHAVRVEIKGLPDEVHELEEFQVSGTLAADSMLLLKTPITEKEYKVIFPEGSVRVEGRLIDGSSQIKVREIETSFVVEDEFEVIGLLQPQDTTLALNVNTETSYTLTFPPRLIKVEGILDTSTTPSTITAREVEVFP